MNARYNLVIIVILFCQLASAGGTVRTPGGGTTGTPQGGGDGLFSMDVWGKLEGEKINLRLGTETVVPKASYTDVFGIKQKSRTQVHVLPYAEFAEQISPRVARFANLYADHAQGFGFRNNREQWGFDTQSLIARYNLQAGWSFRLTDRLQLAVGVDVGIVQMKLDYAFDINRIPLPIYAKSEAYGWGVGLSCAAIYEPNDRIRLGMQISSPMTVAIKGETQVLGLSDSWKTEMDFPLRIQLAASWQVTERLGLAVDINWYNFSKNDNDIVMKFEGWKIRKPLALGWVDTVGIHGGFNYQLTPKTTVRGGIGYLTRTVNNLDTITLDVPGWDVSAGFSYKISDRTTLNAAFIRGWGKSEKNTFFGTKKFTADVYTVAVDFNVRF